MQLSFEDVPAEDEPEIWLPVVGFEGLYEVSSLGRIKSLPRNTTRGGIMKLHLRADGHLDVTLTRNGVQGHRRVHQLVAEAFIGPCPDGMEVCHNDGDAVHNVPSNLRWDTHSANMIDRVKHGRSNTANVEECPKGHPYDEANTYWYDGRRFCLTCKRAFAIRSYYRREAKKERPDPVETACPQCGTLFFKAKGAHRRKYCSDSCGSEARRLAKNAAYAVRKAS